MNERTVNKSRRRAIKALAASIAVVPVLLVDTRKGALASDLPQLAEDDAQASALGYHHDTTAVDGSKYPNHSPDRVCSGCQLIQSDEGEWRPCGIFPGKAVNENGWCTAWVAKAG